ncbi:hypothetical protein ONK29_26725, partial [Salmonella enterica subsp. enterica serovar Anatum]|nr:hypothetical protein [Salmonella enterica subsp. enterica serovar Anatum]
RIEGDIKSTDQIAGHLNVRVERISQPDVNINLVTLDAKGSENFCIVVLPLTISSAETRPNGTVALLTPSPVTALAVQVG